MAFCINCGEKIPDGAKFCPNCGTEAADSDGKRKTVYEGELHKCPNCGEILKSFTGNCPACGYEIRNAKAATSLREFSLMLSRTTTTTQAVALIRNYPIPNTKEDIYEFMILASSSYNNNSEKEISDAWLSKIDQCYQKSQRVFLEGEKAFLEIRRTYNDIIESRNAEIKKIRKSNLLNTGFRTIGFWLGLIIIIVGAIVEHSTYNDMFAIYTCAGIVMITSAFLVGKRNWYIIDFLVGILCGCVTFLIGLLLGGSDESNSFLMECIGFLTAIIVIIRYIGRKGV